VANCPRYNDWFFHRKSFFMHSIVYNEQPDRQYVYGFLVQQGTGLFHIRHCIFCVLCFLVENMVDDPGTYRRLLFDTADIRFSLYEIKEYIFEQISRKTFRKLVIL